MDDIVTKTALHVTNGDCTDLAVTVVADRVLVWFDVLHEGPVPAVPDAELRRTRASFLAGMDRTGDSELVLRRFVELGSAPASSSSRASGSQNLWRGWLIVSSPSPSTPVSAVKAYVPSHM